jgi:SEC-C motif domain protein
MLCPCGSKSPFDACCGAYLANTKLPPTAEALMRSRYVAYTTADIAYLADTHAPETRADFDPVTTRQWAQNCKFTNLNILRVEKGGAGDQTGTVEFIATFTQNDHTFAHHEISRFGKDARGTWFFVDGQSHRHGKTAARDTPKPGRNAPCPCGSGKKWKKCCGG